MQIYAQIGMRMSLNHTNQYFQASWTVWSPWGACSVSCGLGTRVKTRICQNGRNCAQSNLAITACYKQPCPEVRKHFQFVPLFLLSGLNGRQIPARPLAVWARAPNAEDVAKDIPV
jgi:hypothetical protein